MIQMNPGGGHQKNNPRLGRKSRMRGDKQREKKAGRKRLSKEYRRKGARETPLEKEEIVIGDFDDVEYKILYALNKKKAYGNDSADVIKIIRARQVPPRKIDEVLSSFERKLLIREWGRIYKGEDGKTYVSLNIDKKEIIEQYIEVNRP